MGQSKWVWLGLILLVTGLVYANSLPGTFYFDDFGLMLDNPRVSTNFSYWSFLDQYGGRPLTLLTLHWNYQLGGRQPAGYHAVNLALHLAVVALLFLLVEGWTKNRRLAALTALLVALHPLQTQAVNYIWARSVLLMSFFGLLSLWLAPRRPWLSLAALQLAIWGRAEAMVLALPLACLVSRPEPVSALWRRSWGKALPVLLLVNLVSFSWGLIGHAPRQVAWNHTDVWHFWLQQPPVLGQYLALMAWPSGLAIDRPWQDWSSWSVLPIVILLVSGFGFLWRRRRTHPVPVYGMLGCLLMLVPSMLVPNTVLVSESRAYLALAGFAAAACWLLDRLWQRHSRVALALVVVMLAAAGSQTFQRNRLWGDEIGMWQAAVQRFPTFDRVHYNLGFALARNGRTKEAKTAFAAARDLNPADDYSYAALGYCAEVMNRETEAQQLYRHALLLNGSNRYAREGLLRIEARSQGRSVASWADE